MSGFTSETYIFPEKIWPDLTRIAVFDPDQVYCELCVKIAIKCPSFFFSK